MLSSSHQVCSNLALPLSAAAASHLCTPKVLHSCALHCICIASGFTAFELNEACLAPAGRGQGTSHPMRASHSGRSAAPPAFMPATPQQALPPGVGDLLDEDEDYVIIEGVSPFSSAHGIM